MKNETSYAEQAADAAILSGTEDMFLLYLLSVLKAHDEDFLESTALNYLETFPTN